MVRQDKIKNEKIRHDMNTYKKIKRVRQEIILRDKIENKKLRQKIKR